MGNILILYFYNVFQRIAEYSSSFHCNFGNLAQSNSVKFMAEQILEHENLYLVPMAYVINLKQEWHFAKHCKTKTSWYCLSSGKQVATSLALRPLEKGRRNTSGPTSVCLLIDDLL